MADRKLSRCERILDSSRYERILRDFGRTKKKISWATGWQIKVSAMWCMWEERV